MMFYIVRKFTLVNNEIVDSVIGYLENTQQHDSFEAIHGTPFIDWVESTNPTNKNDWFITNTHFYLIDSKEELLDGIALITNLNNPEAV